MINRMQMDEIGFSYIKEKLTPNSPYGAEYKRKLRLFKPGEMDELICELSNVAKLASYIGKHCYDKLARIFMGLKDIRRSILAIESLTLNEIELFEIKRFLLQLDLIAPLFAELNDELNLEGISIPSMLDALDVLDPDQKRNPSFMIPSASSKRLKNARDNKRLIEQQINVCVDESLRSELISKRAAYAAIEESEESLLRKDLCRKLTPYAASMLAVTDAIGRLDFAMAKAQLAYEYGCSRPFISEDSINMVDMFNPAIADAIKHRSGGKFTPLSIKLNKGTSVITGANMGGKSVVINTVALNVLCVHAGIFPFAGHCETPLFNDIYIISEAKGDYKRGLSSFGSEITHLNEALDGIEQARLSLVLVDELARGTNPDEGAAIVKGVVKYIKKRNCISLFATHYDGVAAISDRQYRVVGLRNTSIKNLKAKIDMSGENGVSTIENAMHYGIYEVTNEEIVPHDALTICELLGTNTELMDYIKKCY